MPVYSKLLSAVALVALVVSGNAKNTNLRSNQAAGTGPPGSANCVYWRQTGGCKPDGTREPDADKPCWETISSGASGYCECKNGNKKESTCDHGDFTCNDACGGVPRLGVTVNIGSTEVDFACCGPYDSPGIPRGYQKGERFQGKNDDGRICFGCGNSKTITVTPSAIDVNGYYNTQNFFVFDQKIELPYGTTITCPQVVNKDNWLSGLVDTDARCSGWVTSGYCASTHKYYNYMLNNCALSCKKLAGETHERWGDTFGITVAGNKITAQSTDKRE